MLSAVLLSVAAEHYENINIDDLEDLFSEEMCIEGSFKYSNVGKTIQLTGLSSLEVSKDEWQGLSPLQMLNELAFLNNIEYLYDLIDEEGPPHKKNFIVSLQLGKENYKAEGASIKKAKIEVAKLALNSTSYIQPPRRQENLDQASRSKTQVQQLDDWVNKHSGLELTYSYDKRPDHEDADHETGVREHNIYSKAQNVFRVVVKVSDLVQARGEGTTAVAAKENAAQKALSHLKSAGAFCMFVDNSFFSFQSNHNSPISLVHQFGNTLGTEVNFEIVSEEGPAHIKRFVFKCSVGRDYETLGEGSSKKAAKHAAAEAMIKQLKSVSSNFNIDCDKIVKKKSKNKKPNNFVKSVPMKPPYEFDDDSKNPDLFPKDLDPVSKLFQIQQAKHNTLPVFKLLDEENRNPNEFQMEVNIGDLAFVGTGRNKKEAKRRAAEGMLKKLGVVVDGDKTRLASPEHKVEQFMGKKASTPDPKQHSNVPNEETHREKRKPKQSHHSNKESNKNRESRSTQDEEKKSSAQSKNQLKNFAQQMGFKFQFSDFPRKVKTFFLVI